MYEALRCSYIHTRTCLALTGYSYSSSTRMIQQHKRNNILVRAYALIHTRRLSCEHQSSYDVCTVLGYSYVCCTPIFFHLLCVYDVIASRPRFKDTYSLLFFLFCFFYCCAPTVLWEYYKYYTLLLLVPTHHLEEVKELQSATLKYSRHTCTSQVYIYIFITGRQSRQAIFVLISTIGDTR